MNCPSTIYPFCLTMLLALGFAAGCVEEDVPLDSDEQEAQAIEELEDLVASQEPTQDEPTRLDGKADRASNIFHGCTTSTILNGTRWSYQTNWINNARQHISVYVTAQNGRSAPQVYGPISLAKQDTDLWKDVRGNITLRLVNKGAGKSIRVFHNALNLLAREANGWCRTVDPVSGFDERSRTNLSQGAHTALNGRWKVFSEGNRLVDTTSAPGFGFDLGSRLDRGQTSRGLMDMYRKCTPIATATYVDDLRRLEIGAVTAMSNLLNAKFLVDQVIEGIRCYNNRDDMLIPVKRRIDGYTWNRGADFGVFRNRPHLTPGIRSFIAGCGTSDSTYYLELFTANQQYRRALACVHVFSPNNRPGYMRIRAIDYEGSGNASEWLTFIKD